MDCRQIAEAFPWEFRGYKESIGKHEEKNDDDIKERKHCKNSL